MNRSSPRGRGFGATGASRTPPASVPRLLLAVAVLAAMAVSLVPGGPTRPTVAHAAAAGGPVPGAPVPASLAAGRAAELPSTTALAPGGKPRTAASYYITSTDPGRGYDLGCRQGRMDAPLGRVDTVVALLFGGQNAAATGTHLVRSNAGISNERIAEVSQAFASGYWTCTGGNESARLFLSIATNNSGWSVSRAGGQAWGHLVNKIKSYVVDHYDQVVVLGGNDIEPAWNSYAATAAWVDGYSSVAWQMFLNLPSAEGCPITAATGGPCDNGWTQHGVWWLSYGHPLALAAPQIYYRVNAQQWKMIALYGASQGKPSRYLAALDQYPADPSTLDAAGSWGALQEAMNSHPATASAVAFSMEVSYA